MPLPTAYSSVTSLVGGLRVNNQLGLAAYDDPAGKLAALISQVMILQSNVILIQSAVLSANASAVTFSSLSGVVFTVFATVPNFLST